MECYDRGRHSRAEGAIDLLIDNGSLIAIQLCQPHYRQAWGAERIGWWGGSGVGRQIHHRDGNPRNNDPDNLELR